MTNDICCPKCRSENVVFSKKRGVNVCEDCHHEFVHEQPVAPLRIFLRYGHDSNEELVRRIKTDLQQRGHDVWFDKSEVKGGADRWRSITDGILASHRGLLFLSKHSTRDSGTCLDEIAIGVKGGNIQTILVEGEREVKPPASIRHIQCLDMHDWKERRDRSQSLSPTDRDAADSDWGASYQQKVAEIETVVEIDERRRFAGDVWTLEEPLKPMSSDSRIHQLLRKGLIAREWLGYAIEEWRLAANRAADLDHGCSRCRLKDDPTQEIGGGGTHM